MRGIKTILMVPMAALVLLAAGCTGNAVDDAGSADVILEIIGFNHPPITATVATEGVCSTTTTTTCTGDSDCPVGESCVLGCLLTVVDWSVDLAAVPKNAVAADPLNDIVMIDVGITYNWPTAVVAPNTIGLGGITVPTAGSATVNFSPLQLQDLQASMESTTGSLVLVFRGQTIEGTTITRTVLQDLHVEVCQ